MLQQEKMASPVLQLNSSISRSVYVVKELLEYLCGEHSQHLGIVPCEGERVDGSGWGMNVIPTGEDDLLTVDVQFDAPVQTDEVFGVKAVEMTRYIRSLGTLGLHSEELISGVSWTADEAVDLLELLKPVPLTIVQGKRLHIFWEAIEMRPELGKVVPLIECESAILQFLVGNPCDLATDAEGVGERGRAKFLCRV